MSKDLKKCSACTMERQEIEFQRKGKTFKTCNRCSDYHKKRGIMKPHMVLEKLFQGTQNNMSVNLQQKYMHIKALEQMLLQDIYVEWGSNKK